jgi:phage shock protein A
MSIADRLRRLVKANINEGLDKIENPEKLLKQRIRELGDSVSSAKQAVTKFAVSVVKVEKEQEQLKRLKAEWLQKAESSLKIGDEDMARRALSEKVKVEERIQELEPSAAESRKIYDDLKKNLQQLNDRLRSSKLKLAELQSRQEAAKARKAFGEHFDNTSGSSVSDDDFAKMEEKVLHAEAEVDIDREVRNEMLGIDETLEQKSQELRVDSELEALKKQIKT